MNTIDNLLRRYAWYRQWRGLPDPQSLRMTDITREALRILYGKAYFLNSINREFTVSGGETLTFRRNPEPYAQKAGKKENKGAAHPVYEDWAINLLASEAVSAAVGLEHTAKESCAQRHYQVMNDRTIWLCRDAWAGVRWHLCE